MVSGRPNAYFYSYTAPGEKQKVGAWTQAEHASFQSLIRDAGGWCVCVCVCVCVCARARVPGSSARIRAWMRRLEKNAQLPSSYARPMRELVLACPSQAAGNLNPSASAAESGGNPCLFFEVSLFFDLEGEPLSLPFLPGTRWEAEA